MDLEDVRVPYPRLKVTSRAQDDQPRMRAEHIRVGHDPLLSFGLGRIPARASDKRVTVARGLKGSPCSFVPFLFIVVQMVVSEHSQRLRLNTRQRRYAVKTCRAICAEAIQGSCELASDLSNLLRCREAFKFIGEHMKVSWSQIGSAHRVGEFIHEHVLPWPGDVVSNTTVVIGQTLVDPCLMGADHHPRMNEIIL